MKKIKMLKKDEALRIWYWSYRFQKSQEEIAFLIDKGIVDAFARSANLFDRELFYRRLVDGVYNGHTFYSELKTAVGAKPIEEIDFNADFEFGTIEYEIRSPHTLEDTFDPLRFFLNSMGINDEWREELTKIYNAVIEGGVKQNEN